MSQFEINLYPEDKTTEQEYVDFVMGMKKKHENGNEWLWRKWKEYQYCEYDYKFLKKIYD